MAEILSYRDLEVWKKSMSLCEIVYRYSRQLPDLERYNLTTQMTRAAVSIPSNIAEGFGAGKGNYVRHLNLARGSLMELETQMDLCVRLRYFTSDEISEAWRLSQEVGKMLTTLIAKLQDSASY